MAPIAAIGLGATALGAMVGAAGSIMGGLSNAAMYNYQAGIARMNAQIARQNSAYEIGVGESQAQQSGLKTAQRLGQIRAAQGASGLDVNAGTAVDVRVSEGELGAVDQTVIRGNALKRAYGQEVIAVQEDAQAQADTMAGSNSEIAGFIGAGSSILGGVGTFSSRWMQGQSVGLI
jgi:hypothetical protein